MKYRVSKIKSYIFDADRIKQYIEGDFGSNYILNQGLKKIGSYAFYKCSNLKTITIPASVTSIGDSAFEDCTNLKTIIFEGNVEQWNNITFGKYWKYETSLSKIMCLDGTIDAKTGSVI